MFSQIIGSGGEDPSGVKAATVLTIMNHIVAIAASLIAVIALVYIIIAGIQYITAGGDSAKQAEAKNAIQAAVMGIIITGLAFVLVNAVLRQLKFKYTILESDGSKPAQELLKP